MSHRGVKPCTDYTKYMGHRRFKDVRTYMCFCFADTNKEGTDVWWQIIGGIDGFNANRKKVVQSPNKKVMDETMSAFFSDTRKTGNLPHLSYVMRKPEPLGTEFKTMAAADLGKSTVLRYIKLLRYL